jgi:hypothetical protein
VAGAGVLIGSVTGGVALSKAGTVKAQCPTMSCSSGLAGDIAASTTLGNVSTAMFVIGGVGAAAAVAGFVLSPSAKPAAARAITPWIGPAGGGVSGRF